MLLYCVCVQTYIGEVLLFVNPFTPLDIYSQEACSPCFNPLPVKLDTTMFWQPPSFAVYLEMYSLRTVLCVTMIMYTVKI